VFCRWRISWAKVFIFLITWKNGLIVKYQGYEIIGRFKDVGGLLETADVRFRSYPVGKVSAITPTQEYIDVTAKVQNGVKIPKGSIMRIEFDGLIGQKYIGIVVGGNSKDYLRAGDIIPGIKTSGLVDFVDVGTKSMEQAKEILAAIQRIVGDPAVGNALRHSLTNLEATTEHLNTFIPKVTEMITNLDRLTGRLADMLDDGQVGGNIKTFSTNISQASADLKDVIQQIKGFTNDPKTSEQLKQMLNNLNEISTQVKEVVSDAENKKNIKKTLKSTGELSDSFSEVKLTNQIDVLQSSPLTGGGNSRWTGRFATRLKTTPRDAFGFSVGETPLGTTLLALTKDQLLTSKLALQFGMFYTRPGVGVSYDLLDNLTLSAAVYDLNNLYTSYAARFRCC
jgi:phospholipid/cholesterol/gamma-HCH transport system substrate-binding protein